MMKYLASLLFTACASHTPVPAAPAPVTTPPPATCTATGDVLFEIDTNDLSAGPEKNAIYANGAWKLDVSGGGTKTGCLAPADLATIQRDVGVSWQSAPAGPIQCHMVHAATNYLVHGKLVYENIGCPSGVLDSASATALAEIEQIMKTAEK